MAMLHGACSDRPTPPSHCDAVDDCKLRVLVCRDQMIQLVFRSEIGLVLLLSLSSLLVPSSEPCDVSTCAKCSALAFSCHDICHVALAPFILPSNDLSAHAAVQEVEFLRSVEGDAPHTTPIDQHDIVGLIV